MRNRCELLIVTWILLDVVTECTGSVIYKLFINDRSEKAFYSSQFIFIS
jgi:hypothetical protein